VEAGIQRYKVGKGKARVLATSQGRSPQSDEKCDESSLLSGPQMSSFSTSNSFSAQAEWPGVLHIGLKTRRILIKLGDEPSLEALKRIADWSRRYRGWVGLLPRNANENELAKFAQIRRR